MHAIRSVFGFLLTVYNKFNEHRGSLLAAGIAFFTFFSLFPLLLFTSVVLSYVLEDPAVRAQIMDYVFANFPALADLTRDILLNPLIDARTSAGIIALIGLLWAGTNLFAGMAVGLNAVYGVAETRNLLVQKLISIGVFLIISVLILFSFGASTLATVFRDELLRLLFPAQVATVAWRLLIYLLSAISSLLLFLVIYKLVPNVKLRLKDIWLGTVAAALAWEVAKYLFAFYLNAFASRSYGVVYGSLATIVLLMFWLYISATLFLFGAEINVAYNSRLKGGAKTFEPRKGGQQAI